MAELRKFIVPSLDGSEREDLVVSVLSKVIVQTFELFQTQDMILDIVGIPALIQNQRIAGSTSRKALSF